MAFVDALNIELERENYVGILKSRSLTEGMFSLNFLDGNIVIQVSILSSGQCSVWDRILSDQDMTIHVCLNYIQHHLIIL